MALNWTPEVIEVLIICGIIVIISGIILKEYYIKRFKAYMFFGLAIAFLIPYFLLDGLSILSLNPFFKRFDVLSLFISLVLIVILINYTQKESLLSINLIPVFCLGTILIWFAIQPDAVGITVVDSTFNTVWLGNYSIVGFITETSMILCLFWWIYRTWRNSPFEIKKESTFFLVSIIFAASQIPFILVSDFFIPETILLANLIFLIALIIATAIIIKEPKILYVLPYTPYRIFVRNKKGVLLCDRIWAKTEINNKTIDRFLDVLIQEEMEKQKRLEVLDIHLKEGVVIFQDLELITSVLVISKSTKFLRDLVGQFSIMFEERYKKFIEKHGEEIQDLTFSDELLDKYFSIFPSRIIDEEKRPLFLSKDHFKIPDDIDERLKQILKDEAEYKLVKCEFQRLLEKNLVSEFLELYQELLEDVEENEEDDQEESD